MVQSQLTAAFASQVQAILLPQPAKVAGITNVHNHTWIIFVFLVKRGFFYVCQYGLKLLTSGDPQALDSEIAGITGVSHSAWPNGTLMRSLWESLLTDIFSNIYYCQTLYLPIQWVYILLRF